MTREGDGRATGDLALVAGELQRLRREVGPARSEPPRRALPPVMGEASEQVRSVVQAAETGDEEDRR